MHATRQNKSKLACLITLILTIAVLSGCSRDNPLSIPEPFIEVDSYCLEGSPYTPKILESILISDFDISETIDPPTGSFDSPATLINTSLTLAYPYLIDQVTIKPEIVTDVAILPSNGEGFIVVPGQTDTNGDVIETEEVPVILTKQVNLELLLNLADSESNLQAINNGIDPLSAQELIDGGFDSNLINQTMTDLFNYIPEVNSLTVIIETESVTQVLDDEVDFLTTNLKLNENEFLTRAIVNIRVPRTFYDCENPLTEKELNSEDFETEDLYKNISIEQEFPLYINRKSIDKLNQSELPELDFITLSEQDNFGKVLALNEQFLVVGLPNEDTLAAGIYDVNDFRGSSGFALNENSENSGAVIIYIKDDVNQWQFHRFIKSSNSESGDGFGTSVSISNNLLAVSAIGEDSSGEGIYLTSDGDGQNEKINNVALSSGAVYLYQYDQETDSWTETHYIKPNSNVISDGSYNKSFGEVVKLYENKLLISSPQEDSSNGDAGNSDLPNSGTVYSYRFSENEEKWIFQEALKALNPSANDQFGSSLAISDNIIAVGSPFEDSDVKSILNNIAIQTDENIDAFENNTKKDSGAVYIYSYSMNTDLISLTTVIKPTNSDPFDYFGVSLAIHNTELLVGATGEDSSGKGLNRDMDKNNLSDSGAVYLYTLDESVNLWTENTYIKADDSQENSAFGKYIAFNESNIFISSTLHNSEISDRSGKVYAYRYTNLGLTQELVFQDEGVASEMRFGSSLALFKEKLIVGASSFVSQSSGNDLIIGKIFTYE